MVGNRVGDKKHPPPGEGQGKTCYRFLMASAGRAAKLCRARSKLHTRGVPGAGKWSTGMPRSISHRVPSPLPFSGDGG